ncbi:MAG: tetraacyldisaccharide 4'-kinase [Legionellaceae bacterium]|nr:tetraacyldisaccharide 4'-kinase [Legionellaceae bacterium]
MMLDSLLNALWYGRHPLRWVLYPFSLLYRGVVAIRCVYLKQFKQEHVPVPIIVVGNLTVGGVGKTPLVIAIAQHFTARGLRVGVVSRGYGAKIKHFPHEVRVNHDRADDVGDEPLLLAQKTQVPVVIAPKRMDAVNYLIEQHQVDLIISDDGLQHYNMGRSIEIAVMDGKRGLGNRLCLPAGPLREPPKRLKQVDMVVVNGADWPGAYRFDLVPGAVMKLINGDEIELDCIKHDHVAAVAGIGHPERFFDTLTELGLTYKPYVFPDHHRFVPADFDLPERVCVMTEKDAVKCHAFADERMHVVPVRVSIHHEFWDRLETHETLQKESMELFDLAG